MAKVASASQDDGKERSESKEAVVAVSKPASVPGTMFASSKSSEQLETSKSETSYQSRLLQWAMDRWHWHLKEEDDQEASNKNKNRKRRKISNCCLDPKEWEAMDY